MRKTEFQIIYGLYDTTALADSTYTTASNQSFGDITMMGDELPVFDYATTEHNHFTLCGSMQEMPNSPSEIVFWSGIRADEYGEFSENPTFTITHTEKHSSYGLTFHFMSDYPLIVRVFWYDLDGTKIKEAVFEPDRLTYFAKQQVEDYGKITVIFEKALPYHFVKCQFVEHGTKVVVGKDGLPVQNAKLVESVDILSDKIVIDKLKFDIIDESDDYNVGNIAGMHKVMQNGQQALAYEYVNGTQLCMGKWFLTGFDAKKNVAGIDMVSYEGLLDNVNYREGAVYNGDKVAGEIIEQILQTAGVDSYTISDDVYDVPLYGWLKIQTCRKALREILFMCGAVCDTSRSTSLNIYKPARTITRSIVRAEKFSTESENKDYVSDVSVKYSQYTLADNTTQIAKGVYDAGTHTVDLSSPATSMTITGGTITKQTNNYVTFTVANNDTEVVITGKKYNKEDLSVSASVRKIAAGESRNEKTFTAMLANASQARAIAQNAITYYGLRLGLKIKYMADLERCADWCEVENNNKAYSGFVAGLEKMTTDLTGGFLTTAEMRGYYDLKSEYYYAGGELFAPGNGVI